MPFPTTMSFDPNKTLYSNQRQNRFSKIEAVFLHVVQMLCKILKTQKSTID